MNKYKVEFERVNRFVVDVWANTEAEAELLAREEFEGRILPNRVEHYYESEDPELSLSQVYDVTDTDDKIVCRKNGKMKGWRNTWLINKT